MRDVNEGWLLRVCHANMASFFFICVYLHISRGLYYSSYRSPRIGVWVIGTIIFFLMMAKKILWPNYILINFIKKLNLYFFKNKSQLLTIKPRIKAIYRIGPHNIDVLSVLVCGLLGDWWGDKIKNRFGYSIRFNIEQAVSNSAYIHHLTYLLYNLGYSSYLIPKLIKKDEKVEINRFNYRLSLYTFSSLVWIYDSFYYELDGKMKKKIPVWIEEYITPLGLAHWLMQNGSRQSKQGVYIATHSFTYEECIFLSDILQRKYQLKSTVVKTGEINQWRISIWKKSMPILVSIIKPYIIDEMKYKFKDYI